MRASNRPTQASWCSHWTAQCCTRINLRILFSPDWIEWRTPLQRMVPFRDPSIIFWARCWGCSELPCWTVTGSTLKPKGWSQTRTNLYWCKRSPYPIGWASNDRASCLRFKKHHFPVHLERAVARLPFMVSLFASLQKTNWFCDVRSGKTRVFPIERRAQSRGRGARWHARRFPGGNGRALSVHENQPRQDQSL